MDDLLFFRELTSRLCGTLRLDRALERCFPLLRQAVPLDELRVNLLDPDRVAVLTVAVADRRGSRAMLDDPEVLPVSSGAMAELMGERLPDVRLVRTMGADRATADALRHLPEMPESSLLILRLRLDGERRGAVVLRAEGADRYTAEHAARIEQLNEPFALALDNARTHQELKRLKDLLVDDNRYLQRELRRARGDQIVGADFGLAEVMELVDDVAPLDSPVLLLGETGVGKEVIANAIHDRSRRRDGPLVKVNCGAIGAALIDSELFGHDKGAFTGAIARKRGRFERAAGGTLFLDEVGELPAEAQVRLLRVLQSGEFERVGGTELLQADVRLIAATHRDVQALVSQGRFRDDLYYRINVFPIAIPPLRERQADVAALVHYFLERKAREIGCHPAPELAPGALERLRRYPWPGNVRELANVVERALILSHGRPLTFASLGEPRAGGPARPARPAASEPPVTLDEAMAAHIGQALARTDGKVSGPGGAAEQLGVHPSTLRNRMKKLGIRSGRRRGERRRR